MTVFLLDGVSQILVLALLTHGSRSATSRRLHCQGATTGQSNMLGIDTDMAGGFPCREEDSMAYQQEDSDSNIAWQINLEIRDR